MPDPTKDFPEPQSNIVPLHTLGIFLCHSSQDKEQVRLLYNRLAADGLKVWMDERQILPGENWDSVIMSSLSGIEVVIVCLSRRPIDGGSYFLREIKFALDLAAGKPPDSIFIIPLKLEACDLPEILAQFQAVDFYHEDGYERLKKSLKKEAARIAGRKRADAARNPGTKVRPDGTPASFGHQPVKPVPPARYIKPPEETQQVAGKNRGCTIKVALSLAVLLILSIGLWLYLPHGSNQGEAFTYAVMVQDANSRAALRGAKATIYVQNLAPLSVLTDDNGFARLQIPATHSGKQGRLRVELQGYHVSDMNIDLLPDKLPTVITLTHEETRSDPKSGPGNR